MFLDYNLDIGEKSVWKIAHQGVEASKYPFTVNESGVFYAQKNFYTKRYAKNDYQILYTVAGIAELEYEEKKWVLTEGSIVVIDCNKYHDYRTKAQAQGRDQGWTYYWIHVGGEYCPKYYDTIYKNGFIPHMVGTDSELLYYFREALTQIDYTTDSAYIRLSNAVSGILTKIILLLSSASPSPQELIVHKAISYIRSHYKNGFTIDDLSKHLNLSKYYLIKLFSKHVGMTPYHYLIQYRINEAKKLLRTTDYKINDIAETVGFYDISNFIRAFTKHTGVTPAKYRDNI